MRITFVSHALPPYEFAGTPIYTMNLAKATAALGHEVTLFSRLEDKSIPTYRVHDEVRDGLRIRFVNRAVDWSNLARSYKDAHMKGIFARFLDEVKPEIVHFQHLVGLGIECIEAVTERRIKSVMTLNDFWAQCPMGQRVCYTDLKICDPIDFEKCGPCVFGPAWETMEERTPPPPARPPSGILERFELEFKDRVNATAGRFARRPRALLWAAGRTIRSIPGNLFGDPDREGAGRPEHAFAARIRDMQRAFSPIDLLVAPSAFLRDEFIRNFGVSPSRIIQSGYGMDLSYIEPLPKTPSKALRFGFMGTIIRPKGVHILVDGFLRAVTGRVNMELHLFGAPNAWTQDYYDELRRKAAHCPHVTFHGPFDNKSISRVLQQFDVLVVPSIWFENAPLTLSEAAISGTPVLVSDRGGMLEFVRTNEFGWTFKLGDPKDLAEQMCRLADDPDLVRNAGTAPRIKGLDANAAELAAIYRALLDGTWRPPATTSPRAENQPAAHPSSR
jgi:glycosyltransferase involved in cell wall biosynthesis